MKKQKENNLLKLFRNWSGAAEASLTPMPMSGSYREYYRIQGGSKTVVGVYNADKKENIAFLSFSRHFKELGLAVPEIYLVDEENDMYLQEDLGNTSLFSYLTAVRKGKDFPPELFNLYKTVVEDLPRFQIHGAKGLDYSVCYPRASFDRQSMLWDLSYFKYYFLKLAKIPFDEQDLEDDFHKFTDFLLQADRDYFLYRDFQSRNIMIRERKPYYIDYQGGRKGALQYDLASLLYDSKADIPQTIREKLLKQYIEALRKYITVDEEQFLVFYQGYSLIRLLQAMGAYGFRGFYEKKTHFLQSIPYALENLKSILETLALPVQLPHLTSVLSQLIDAPELQKFRDQKRSEPGLTVTISSFSYKTGIPADESGNGGGFVFDCRAVHNPGRYEQYKDLTGMDQPVIDFFKSETEIDKFLEHVFALVDMSVEKYMKRDFTSLAVNFGCTGGQHRSVYCAEKLAKLLREKYDIHVEVNHTGLERKKLKAS